MKSPILTFGEVLWDSLPRGLFPGGAPFNVAGHLAHLNPKQPVTIVSAVGADFLGRELRRRAEVFGVDTRYLAVVDSKPTGTVEATLDAQGHATYNIVDNVAWDHIPLPQAVVTAAAEAPAVVFGTLACRHAGNRDRLIQLLGTSRGLRVYDINLRPPYTPESTIERLLPHADLIKLNDEELDQMTDCGSKMEHITAGIDTLQQRSPACGICVTCGPRGAVLRWQGSDYYAAAPDVTVRDTIGAGDAFTAALVNGLTSGGPLDCAEILTRASALGSFVASKDGAIPY